jgi:hypothetical protein
VPIRRTGLRLGQLENRAAGSAQRAKASDKRAALQALEWAGVLSWQNRITRAVVRQRDLFGRWSNRWTVIRTSNAYVFTDPKAAENSHFRAASENPTGTQNQEIRGYLRPVLRERIEGRSIADMDRDAIASRDRQLAELQATMV